uniref:Uncharacterized protein n=1 Tax=Parascaris equorum TaxID=6256 RepID=A0A914SIP0_PAREQ
AIVCLLVLNSTKAKRSLKIIFGISALCIFELKSSDGSSRMKDIALSILLCVLIAVLVLYKRQRSRSRNEMEQLTSKLRQLKSMESDFEDVQQKFEEERKKRQSVSEAIVAENAQMETLRSQLMEAERLLESSSSAPLALQPLLRRLAFHWPPVGRRALIKSIRGSSPSKLGWRKFHSQWKNVNRGGSKSSHFAGTCSTLATSTLRSCSSASALSTVALLDTSVTSKQPTAVFSLTSASTS